MLPPEVRRLAPLPGWAPLGVVSSCQPCEISPKKPRELWASAATPPTGISASTHATAIERPRRRRAASGCRSAAKRTTSAAANDTTSAASRSRPSRCPARAARRQRDVVVGQRRLLERPRDHGRRGHSGDRQQRERPQAQRHQHEPQRRADDRGEHRAARVGEHERDQQQRERRGGERVEDAVALAAGAEPQARRDPERRRQPDRVPVVKRRLQAREAVAGVEALGDHVAEDRVGGEHDRRDQQARDHAAPARADQPHERDRAGEGRRVGERAVGLEPGVGGRDRPADRQRGQRGERAQPDRRADPEDTDPPARLERGRRGRRGCRCRA